MHRYLACPTWIQSDKIENSRFNTFSKNISKLIFDFTKGIQIKLLFSFSLISDEFQYVLFGMLDGIVIYVNYSIIITVKLHWSITKHPKSCSKVLSQRSSHTPGLIALYIASALDRLLRLVFYFVKSLSCLR